MSDFKLLDNSKAQHTFTEEEKIRDKWWNVEDNEVVIDIGCYYESYTLPACDAGAKVIAIDANREHVEHTKKHLKMNGLLGHAEVIYAALYNGVNIDDRLLNIDSIHAVPEDTNWDTLDNIVDNLNLSRLDRIKVDTEAFELDVLYGAIKTILKYRPSLSIEDHSGEMYQYNIEKNTSKRIEYLLKSLNYTFEREPYANRSFIHAIYRGENND